MSNLSKEEWTALKNLNNRKDLFINAAAIGVVGGAIAVWGADLYRQEAFYAKADKHLTSRNQKIGKDTIQALISKPELPPTAENLVITPPRPSVIYFKPKIHNTTNPGRPIVSAFSCPIELISSYLDKIMTPIVKTLWETVV